MCELYGRDNIDMFSELILTGKTVEDITQYSGTFWKNYTKIENYKKYLERIEKGEAAIAHRNSIDKAIEDKFAQLMDKFLSANPGKTTSDFTLEDIHIKYDKV